MRRTARNHGFLLCLLLNMAFRFEWAIAAIILLAIHFWLGWPLFLVWIALGIWVLYSLFVTLVLSAANHAGNEPTPQRPNKNPYSKSNTDFPQNP
jgi:fatty acid desaturase